MASDGTRAARRRETAEDFTPEWLVDEMLDQLSPSLWLDTDSIFLDPSCGNGNFLIGAKKKLVEDYGNTEEEANRRLFGIDILHDNVVEACTRLGIPHEPSEPFAVSSRIVCADTLNYENLEEIFCMAEKTFFEGREERLKEQVRDLLKAVRPVIKSASNTEEKKAAISVWKTTKRLIFPAA